MTRAQGVAKDRLLRVREAAGYCVCCDKTIRRAIQAGELEAVRVGNQLRISPQALKRYLQRDRAR